MSGSYNELGDLVLAGGEWIERPSGYVTVNLNGAISNSTLYQGNVTSSQGAFNCTTFSLKKE